MFRFPAWASALVVAGKLSVASAAASDPIPSSLAELPADMDRAQIQLNFDDFAWLQFIALNWPADSRTCEPDRKRSIGELGGPRVWETWPTDSEVFVPSGSRPSPWCNQLAARRVRLSQVPGPVRKLTSTTGIGRSLPHTAKAWHSHVLPSPGKPLPERGANGPGGLEQAVDGVLVDQNGRFVRYESRLNQDEYNYLMTNTLWSKQGQRNASINMPAGPEDLFCNRGTCGPKGSVEVKAAWKVLGANDDPTHFYTIQAIVFNDDRDPPTPSPGKNPVTLGLVGMHIAHKTASQRNWLWATFEQVENVTKSFNNPACQQAPPYTPDVEPPCTSACCAPNTQTAARNPRTGKYEELDRAGKPLHRPTQVVRVGQILNPRWNTHYQELLEGTVWANYQLVSIQWQGPDSSLPSPEHLANTTIETFNQGPSPATDGTPPYPQQGYEPFSTRVSSSCMKCHQLARTTSGRPADFSFILRDAK